MAVFYSFKSFFSGASVVNMSVSLTCCLIASSSIFYSGPVCVCVVFNSLLQTVLENGSSHLFTRVLVSFLYTPPEWPQKITSLPYSYSLSSFLLQRVLSYVCTLPHPYPPPHTHTTRQLVHTARHLIGFTSQEIGVGTEVLWRRKREGGRCLGWWW